MIAPELSPTRLLRLRWIARDLDVSERWVRCAATSPADRQPGRCAGIPRLPTVRHPRGGRAVVAAAYLAWRAEWLR